jgi:hypothetical protein
VREEWGESWTHTILECLLRVKSTLGTGEPLADDPSVLVDHKVLPGLRVQRPPRQVRWKQAQTSSLR